MKKILCILLATWMMLVLASCGDDVEHKIYRGNGTQNESVELNGKTVTYYSASEFQLDNSAYLSRYDSETAAKNKSIVLERKEWNFEYSKSLEYGLSKSVDQYAAKDSNGNIEAMAEFNQKTGKMVQFSFLGDEAAETGDFTMEMAKKKADELIKSMCGEDVLDGFVLKTENVVEILGQKRLAIKYARYECGYITSEYIKVWYNLQGELIVFNAKTVGIFDSVEDDLSKNKIENAEKALLDALPEGAYVQDDRILRIDAATGIVYLEMVADGKVYYVNVT